LEHLDAPQSRELLQLFDKFAGRFSDEAGLCDAAVHRVGFRLAADATLARARQVQAGGPSIESRAATEERRRHFCALWTDRSAADPNYSSSYNYIDNMAVRS